MILFKVPKNEKSKERLLDQLYIQKKNLQDSIEGDSIDLDLISEKIERLNQASEARLKIKRERETLLQKVQSDIQELELISYPPKIEKKEKIESSHLNAEESNENKLEPIADSSRFNF